MVQEKIADSWIELEQFRLLILRTAWLIDKYHDYKRVQKDIAAVKATMPKLLHDIATRALHLHGSIGVTDEMPFVNSVINSLWLGLADGPTEVHKVTIARQVLRDVKPTQDLFPTYHLPRQRAHALAMYGDVLEDLQGEL
jgi:acyl-CoA dehydrogenase